MSNRKKLDNNIDEIFPTDNQTEETKEAPKIDNPVETYGIGMRKSEWERVEQIAAEMGITKHAFAVYGLRYFLKAYEAGEIPTTSKPRLPGL